MKKDWDNCGAARRELFKNSYGVVFRSQNGRQREAAAHEMKARPDRQSLTSDQNRPLEISQPLSFDARGGGPVQVGVRAAFLADRLVFRCRENPTPCCCTWPISQPLRACLRGVPRAGAPLFHRPPSAGAMAQSPRAILASTPANAQQ